MDLRIALILAISGALLYIVPVPWCPSILFIALAILMALVSIEIYKD